MTASINTSSEDTFDILRLLSSAQRPLGVKEIADQLGLPPSTTHRCLMTLVGVGYAGRYQSSATYIVGDAARRLRQAFFMRQRIRDLCQPYLHQLAFMTGETTTLTVIVGWYAVCVQVVSGTNDIISFPELGTAHFLDATPSGKAILAYLSDDALARYFQWRERQTGEASSVSRAELCAIAKAGYTTEATNAPDRSKLLAFPILYNKRAIASITIDGATMNPKRAKKDELNRLQTVIHEVEALLSAERVETICPFAIVDPATIALNPTPIRSRN